MRRGLRPARAEQPLLAMVGINIGHAVAAIGEHPRQIPQHPPWILRRSALPVAANASDSQPGRTSNQQRHPACDTSLSPSAVTSTVPSSVVSFTRLGSSWIEVKVLSNPHSHSPAGRHPLASSACYRRIAVRGVLRGTVTTQKRAGPLLSRIAVPRRLGLIRRHRSTQPQRSGPCHNRECGPSLVADQRPERNRNC